MIKRCPNGHGPKEGNYCNLCAAELEVIVSITTPVIVSGDLPCPTCGGDLKHSHQKECPYCHQLLNWVCN